MKTEHIKCPLCKHKRAKLVFSSGFNILQCQRCQLYFHEKYFTLQELEKFYALDYCHDKGTSKDIKNPKQFSLNEEKYKAFLKKSLRKKFIPIINQFTPPLDILEIGADAGGASFYMKELGHNVEAVEICKEYAERMETKGIKVYNTLFENIEFDKKYDIIVALEVIEHFSNPIVCIDKIYDLLKEGGYFIFETPIAKSGLVENASYAVRLAHYCIFNPVSLRKLLEKFQDIPNFEHHEESNYVYIVRKEEKEKKQLNIDLGAAKHPTRNHLKWEVMDISKACDYHYNINSNEKMPLADNSVDNFYSSMTIEHTKIDCIENVLKEIWRILKPDGRVRLVVPDISLGANWYVNNELQNLVKGHTPYKPSNYPPTILGYFLAWVITERPKEADGTIPIHAGHNMAFDFETMKWYMEKVGFRNIEKLKYNEGSEEFKNKDLERYAHYALYVEAQKPNEVKDVS